MLTNNQITDTSCPVCNSSLRNILFEVYDHEYHTTEQKFPLNMCNNCQTVYLSPRPNAAALSIIYPSNYSNYHTDETKSSYVRRVSNYLQSQRIKLLFGDYDLTDKSNILDVGCGDGFMLDRIRDVFPTVRTTGIEPDSVAAAYASKRHEIYNGIIEDFESPSKFDIIISSHVIEHVANPVAFLGKMKSLLNEDGIIIIDTPNINCAQYRLFGKHWGGIHAPRHWTLFNQNTLHRAAEEAGLKTVNISENPICVFWVWSIHSWLYEWKFMRSAADRLFDPIGCVSSNSIYYFCLLTAFEVLERILKFIGLGVGQQRGVFRI